MHEITVQSDGFSYKLRWVCFATSATSPPRYLALTSLAESPNGCSGVSPISSILASSSRSILSLTVIDRTLGLLNHSWPSMPSLTSGALVQSSVPPSPKKEVAITAEVGVKEKKQIGVAPPAGQKEDHGLTDWRSLPRCPMRKVGGQGFSLNHSGRKERGPAVYGSSNRTREEKVKDEGEPQGDCELGSSTDGTEGDIVEVASKEGEASGKGGTSCCREGGPGRHDRPDFRVIA